MALSVEQFAGPLFVGICVAFMCVFSSARILAAPLTFSAAYSEYSPPRCISTGMYDLRRIYGARADDRIQHYKRDDSWIKCFVRLTSYMVFFLFSPSHIFVLGMDGLVREQGIHSIELV